MPHCGSGSSAPISGLKHRIAGCNGSQIILHTAEHDDEARDALTECCDHPPMHRRGSRMLIERLIPARGSIHGFTELVTRVGGRDL